ncbi:toxin HicA [Dermatophilus congolensis]|uniref:toxin HicA n=1 Tax=Dermatophilus congolensis TaxID=1863 RepID=UPI001AAF175C|nr:toxin HicA [Dermatophilus congolensis]MBO3146356.1 toxin HicA [Dermatophilus congolensis]MBO3148601.1 toxin HicA [Dermatophilus congolensis]MBO3157593.1 toxin HicA [Dermatophilus congolensis]MBO3159873.1 toxin HicA [Dermatophilus congolensis]MBO3166612.1 toxin HicA [Dermatophilus congolensis]
MPSVEKILAQMQSASHDVRYTDLVKVCEHFFGPPRQRGSSHCVFKMPWQGDPRINLQNSKGKAKSYQVKQALIAIQKKQEEKA